MEFFLTAKSINCASRALIADQSSEIMEYASSRKNQKGAFEGLYRLIMRRNSVYVTFIIAGAFFGERAVDYGVHKLWESNNIGKRYEDISVLGQRPVEE